jgi:hypothetical protein
MTIVIPSGFFDSMDSSTRNPTAELFVSWKDVLVSGEWFRLDQSLTDGNSLLTSKSYLNGESIIELIIDADAKLYDDESIYVKMLEGYSELIGDSFHYATSDLDFELDNTDNRFTPRANINLLANPGFEQSKTSWNEVMEAGAKTYIDEVNVRAGIRSYQIYNPNKNKSYAFSDRMSIANIADSYTYSQYITGSGVATLQLRSFGLSNSGVNNFTTGELGTNSYQITLVSGVWNRPSVSLDVPSGAWFIRSMFSASGTWLRADDGQVEQGLTSSAYSEDFIGDLILPKKAVKVNVGFNTNNVKKFSGAIQKITPNIKDDVITAYCYDWADALKDKKITSTYYENLRTDQIISNLAALAGIAAGKTLLETGLLSITFAWFQEGSIWTYINQIAEAEGGIVFFDEEGILNFYNRTHFSTYPEAIYGFSFDNNITNLGFEISKDRVKNRIEVKANPRKKLTSKLIYELVETVSIGTGETIEVWGQFNYGLETTVPALNVAVPVLGVDILANSQADGLGTNITGNVSISSYSIFQESIKVNIKNNYGSTVYITKFNITGDPIVIKSRIEVIKEDTNSQSLYDTQILAIENDLMDDPNYAITLAQSKLAEMKDPMDAISIECIGTPFLRVGDIVSVQRSFDSTFENFQIIKNRWQFDGDFMQNLELQKKVGISTTIFYPSDFVLTESGEPILLENGEYLKY